MKLIIRKLKLMYLVLTYICLSNSSLAIDPVEIGKFYQKNVEVNLSTIKNLNNINEEKIEIKKDIRTKIKKKENVVIKTKNVDKEKTEIENLIEKRLARINNTTNKPPSEIHILFNSETANIKIDDENKIRN